LDLAGPPVWAKSGQKTRYIKLRRPLLTVAFLLSSSSLAAAEFQFSAYGGWQTAPHSLVEITGIGAESFTAGWQGRSFQTPPYWGLRGTYWFDRWAPQWGVSIDFTHAKVYADPETFANDIPDWSRFEFSDGINILTVNAMRRFERWNGFEPYLGAGVGLSIPHVEVTRPEGTTFNYQVGGAAFQAQIGANYYFTDWLSVFGEYQFNYAMNDLTLSEGAKLKTNIITNAVVGGVSVHF